MMEEVCACVNLVFFTSCSLFHQLTCQVFSWFSNIDRAALKLHNTWHNLNPNLSCSLYMFEIIWALNPLVLVCRLRGIGANQRALVASVFG